MKLTFPIQFEIAADRFHTVGTQFGKFAVTAVVNGFRDFQHVGFEGSPGIRLTEQFQMLALPVRRRIDRGFVNVLPLPGIFQRDGQPANSVRSLDLNSIEETALRELDIVIVHEVIA